MRTVCELKKPRDGASVYGLRKISGIINLPIVAQLRELKTCQILKLIWLILNLALIPDY